MRNMFQMMPPKNSENEAINEEFNRWSKLYIDVEVLKNNHNNKCKEVSALKEKISELESQIRVSSCKYTKYVKDFLFGNSKKSK